MEHFLEGSSPLRLWQIYSREENLYFAIIVSSYSFEFFQGNTIKCTQIGTPIMHLEKVRNHLSIKDLRKCRSSSLPTEYTISEDLDRIKGKKCIGFRCKQILNITTSGLYYQSFQVFIT